MVLSRINRTNMNLLFKVSRFFHDLQVNLHIVFVRFSSLNVRKVTVNLL